MPSTNKTELVQLNQYLGNEYQKRADVNEDNLKIDNKFKELAAQSYDMDYQTAGGTATAITLTMQTLRNGYAKNFIAKLDNGGVATKINTIPVYKPSTTTPPTIKANKPYTVIYNEASTCFFLKASATGTALASQVLKNATFSTEVDTDLVGILDLSLLISTNVKSGITINGVAGDSNVVDTSAGDATAVQILSGKKAYVDGALVTGTATNKGATTITPSASNQIISANTLCTGIQTILGDADLIADNIILGKSIFNIVGNAKKIITSSGTLSCTNGTSGALQVTLPTQSFTVLGWICKDAKYSCMAGSFKIDSIDLSAQWTNTLDNNTSMKITSGFKTTLGVAQYSNSVTDTVYWYAFGY